MSRRTEIAIEKDGVHGLANEASLHVWLKHGWTVVDDKNKGVSSGNEAPSESSPKPVVRSFSTETEES